MLRVLRHFSALNSITQKYFNSNSSRILVNNIQVCYISRESRIQKSRMAENRSHIVWVDLEMSGLNIDEDHILEMACLITDKDLNIVAEGPELIIHQSNEILESMNDWCKQHHGESGLTESVRNSQISLVKAEEIMLEFIAKNVPKEKCPLAGNSIHMDRIFLNKYMPKFLEHLHYRIIDVSTIKELSSRWYRDDDSKKPVKKFSHRALDDIKESIEELQFYRNTIFKNQ